VFVHSLSQPAVLHRSERRRTTSKRRNTVPVLFKVLALPIEKFDCPRISMPRVNRVSCSNEALDLRQVREPLTCVAIGKVGVHAVENQVTDKRNGWSGLHDPDGVRIAIAPRTNF